MTSVWVNHYLYQRENFKSNNINIDDFFFKVPSEWTLKKIKIFPHVSPSCTFVHHVICDQWDERALVSLAQLYIKPLCKVIVIATNKGLGNYIWDLGNYKLQVCKWNK
jgi:hypothetical protein